jgi:uncharacterized protein YjbJ (UPF0337 family)
MRCNPRHVAIVATSRHPKEEAVMGWDDKVGNKAEEASGKVKESVGDATDNERLEAEGKADQSEAKMKQAGEHVKDALDDATDAAKK